jgi:hypothetical protein
MMKKIFISLFAVIYLVIASGMVMNIHYCMGNVTLNHERDDDDGNCNKCGMDKTENHCCTNDTQFLKITDAQQITQQATVFNTVQINALYYQINLTISSQGNSLEPFCIYNSPPPKALNKVYLAVHTFLI